MSPIKILPLLIFALLGSTALDAQEKKKKKNAPKGPWYEAQQPVFASSELGRVYSNTLDLRETNVATIEKPKVIRLGDAQEVTIVFDTERLMMVAAIPERFMMFNTYRNGLGGSGNWMGPPYIFTAAKNANEGRYYGRYQHGTKTILYYAVGDLKILETPWAGKHQDQAIIVRHFEFAPSKTEQAIWLGDATTAMSLRENSKDVGLVTDGDQAMLKVAPGEGARSAQLLVSSAAIPLDFKPAKMALQELTGGGPAQWPKEIVTQGVLGKEKNGFAVDTITPPFENPYKALLFFGGHDFFSNGDAAICTMHGDVWRVSGIDGDLSELRWKRYATGMFHPLGLKVVDDQVYLNCRDQLTKLHDFNGDNEADYYEAFNHDIEIGRHVHEYATGLHTDPAGDFFFVKGNNGRQSKHDGTAFRVSKDGSVLEAFATGFRWPNGSGMSPDGVFTIADQQGTWVPSSKIDIVEKGGFYGFMNAHHREVEPEQADPPLCWIPHKVDNSCGGQAWVPKGKWGALSGKMIHLSYGRCEAFLVLQEKVDGTNQGGVVKLPVHFQSGSMRARFNPHDNNLYVSGLKGWQTSGVKDGCFQRVRKTEATTRLPIGLNVHENGVVLRFAQKLDQELAEDVDSWTLNRWNYRWTKAYGSKDYKVSNPDEVGRDRVELKNAKLLADGQSVFLEIADMKPVMQMAIEYDIETDEGDELFNTVYHTVHKLGPAKR